MTYQEKIDLALSYLNNKEKENDFRPIFSRIFPFSTENLTGFFNAELLQDKKVLITGSSADQIITSQLFNAKKITHFDINPFVEFMYDLKMGAIKELDDYEFLNYFYYNTENSETFRYKLYERIRKQLVGESLEFWDTLYNNFSPIKIRRRLFILNNEEEKNKYKIILPYMFLENYKLLKEKELIPVEFIQCDILNLAQHLNDKYDIIYFSNIFGRQEMYHFYEYDYINNLTKFMTGILDHTKINGKVLLNYFYDLKQEDFYDEKNEMIYSNIRYPIELFNCEDNISYKEITGIEDDYKDTILIYTKKKH